MFIRIPSPGSSDAGRVISSPDVNRESRDILETMPKQLDGRVVTRFRHFSHVFSYPFDLLCVRGGRDRFFERIAIATVQWRRAQYPMYRGIISLFAFLFLFLFLTLLIKKLYFTRFRGEYEVYSPE